jgi:small-conductance mechanosensitive channel
LGIEANELADLNPLHGSLQGEDSRLWIGWQWLEYHSKQRLEMFKFFVMIYGAIVAVAAGFLETTLVFASAILSVVAMMLAGVFWQLDRRSLQLIEIGEHILCARWDQSGFDRELNPVRLAQMRQQDGIRFKYALLVVFIGAGLLACALFVIALYAINYPTAHIAPRMP